MPAYLDAFSGPLRKRLEREIGERGGDAFGEDLRSAARARKSHAVFAAESDGDDAARVTVETIYPDRNERQTYRVERKNGDWLVADVETLRSHQPKAKFGAPANYLAPEGVPVQGAVEVETGDGPDPLRPVRKNPIGRGRRNHRSHFLEEDKERLMRPGRPIAAGLTSLVLIGASVGSEPRGGPAKEARALDPSVTSVRLLLGVGDPTPQGWDGRVRLDRGEVIGVEGWRFRQGDLVAGRDSWTAKIRKIRNAAAPRSNRPPRPPSRRAARPRSARP